MPEFKSLNALFAHISSDLNKSLKRDVVPVAMQEMSDTIKGEQVYGAYESNAEEPYQRRGDDGGLSDIRNYQVEIIDDNTIAITNETLTFNGKPYLDRMIVHGDEYDWKKSEIYDMQPFPRDFYQYTVENLLSNENHIKALKAGLIKMGYKVE